MEKVLIDINLMIRVDHSGASYMWTLKELHYIATHGIDAWMVSRKTTIKFT